MLDPVLARNIHWDQIRLIMEHTESKAKLRGIGFGVGGKKRAPAPCQARKTRVFSPARP